MSLSARERLEDEATTSSPYVPLHAMVLLSMIVWFAPSSKIPRPVYEISFPSIRTASPAYALMPSSFPMRFPLIVMRDDEYSATPIWPSTALSWTVMFEDHQMYTPALPRVETFWTVTFDAKSK